MTTAREVHREKLNGWELMVLETALRRDIAAGRVEPISAGELVRKLEKATRGTLVWEG